jgi:HAE1 family hydrophobic/amphiphilic exporter-1
MAVTVIGGLLTSTVLTLVVVPVMYSLLDRRAEPGKVGVGATAEGSNGAQPTTEALQAS